MGWDGGAQDQTQCFQNAKASFPHHNSTVNILRTKTHVDPAVMGFPPRVKERMCMLHNATLEGFRIRATSEPNMCVFIQARVLVRGGSGGGRGGGVGLLLAGVCAGDDGNER